MGGACGASVSGVIVGELIRASAQGHRGSGRTARQCGQAHLTPFGIAGRHIDQHDFNVGCFAARAGHADQAIEALERAIAINDGVKELIATDEDLDSLREDERFQKLAT